MKCKELTKKMITYVCVVSLTLTGMTIIDRPDVGAAEEGQEESVDLKIIIDSEGRGTDFCKEYDIDGSEYRYLGWIPVEESFDYKYLDMTYSGDESAFNRISFSFEDSEGIIRDAKRFASYDEEKFQTIDGTDVPMATAESQTVRIDLTKSGIDVSKGIKGLHMHAIGNMDDVDTTGKFKIESAKLIKVKTVTDVKKTKVPLKIIETDGKFTDFCKEYDINGPEYRYLGWIPVEESSDYKYLDMTYSGDEEAFNGIRFEFQYSEGGYSNAKWFASYKEDKFQTIEGTDVPMATAESQTVRIDLAKSGIDASKGIKGLHMHVSDTGKCKFKIENAELVKDSSESSDANSNIYKGSSDSNNVDFKLGSTSELTIPSDMPIIGGGKLGLDFGNVPVQFNREGNKFQIGIGVKDLVGLYKNGWTTFKKFVDTQKEEYKKGMNALLASKFGTASMGWSVKPKISCYGYVEGTITEKGIQSAGGKLAIEMSVKASKEWQTIVVVVPVVIKTSAEVGTKLNVSVGADFSKQSVYFNGDLNLTLPKIKLSGGVGVAYICDVSVYGQASNDVKWAFDGDIAASLSGELGVSAKALCFSYEKALLKGTWTYYDNSKAKTRIADNSIGKLSPDKKMSIKVDDTKAEKWNQSSVARALSTENEVILQKDIYDAAKPKILKTDNGKTIITYIEAVKNRSEGNQYAAVYSVYDETTGKWSTPAVVDDDGTADFNLETVADGNNVYFVWSNLKDKISAEELKSLDSESVASKCEIEYAKLDTDTMAVSDNKITSNNNLDTIPGIYADNGKSYVGWVENTNNDVLNLSGTNKIHFGEIDDNSYIESQVKSVSNPVKQVSIGKLGDDIKLAYIEKEDDSNSLNTMDVSGKIDNIKSISGNIENATFSRIDNKNTLLWYSNENNTGTINCLDPEQMNISKLIENNQVSSDYCIVNDGKRDILLSTAVGEDSDSQAIAYVIGQDSGYAELLNSKNKIRNLSTVYREGKYTLLYTDTAADIGENSVDTTTDLKIKTLEADSIVEIESVDYLAEDIMPANKMTVTTQIKNNGLLSETEDIDLVAYYDNEEIGRTSVSDIQSGEEKSVDANITLPDNITKNSSITIRAIKQDKVQGTYKEKMSSTDLELSVNELVGLADVKVSNIGAFATEATLYVYDKDDKGTVLDTYDCGTLQSGENYDVRVDLSKYSGQNVESLMFEAKSNDDEVFEYNNTYSMYIGDDVLKDIDYIRAGKSKTEYNVGEELDLSDITLEAVYKDGTKEKKEKFETNAKDIDMSTAGTKTLTITYEEVGEKRTVDIPIEVKGEPITSQVTTKETTVKPTTQVTTKETTVKPTTPRVTTVKPTTAQVTTKKTTVESTTSQETTSKENIKVQRVQKLTGKNVRKKRISLKWQKVSNVRGYEIQYALDRKFKKSQKTRNTSKVSFVIKKLKKKKVYYVRVRAYVVNMDQKIYGSWSKVRKIKVKK